LLLLAGVLATACAEGSLPTRAPVASSPAVAPSPIASLARSSPSLAPTRTPALPDSPPIDCPELTFDASASLDPIFDEEIFLRDESEAIAADFVEGLESYYEDPSGTDPCALFTAQGIRTALEADARFAAVTRGELRITADLEYRIRFESSHDLRKRPPRVPVAVIFDVAPGAQTHTPPDGPVTSIAAPERTGFHIVFAFDGHRWLADRVGMLDEETAQYATLPAPVPPGPPCADVVHDPADAPFDDDGDERVWCDRGGGGLVLQRYEQVHLITRYWCDEERAAILTIGQPIGARIDPLQRYEYVRDPDDAFLDLAWLAEPFRSDVDLPADAVPTGWTNGNIELWVSPSEIERALYVQRGDRVERWPRAARSWGVIDCN